jgi:hypothetical protein
MTTTDSSKPPQTVNVTVSGFVLPAAVSAICSSSGGPAQTEVPYFNSCKPSGGTGNYQWTIRAGALPNGLSLSPGPEGGIIISGTPTDATPYNFVLQVADDSGPLPLTASIPFAGLPLAALPGLSLNCTGPTTATIYSGQFIQSSSQSNCRTSGGLGITQYSISSGTLPPGLSISIFSPLSLTGYASTAGDYKFTIQYSDSATPPQTVFQNLEIVVLQSLTTPPYQWSISNGTLPPGLIFVPITAGMALEGTPTIAGTYSFSFSVTDSGGQSALWPFSATVQNPNYSGPGTVLPHFAFGAGGQTRFVLYSYANPSSPSLFFFGDSGAPIGVPLTQPSTGNISTTSYFSQKIPRYEVLFVDTAASPSDPLTTGSAQWTGTGFGIFSYPAFNWQALVPLDTVRDSSYMIAFDNTGVLSTGVALASSDPNTISDAVTVNDDKGNILLTTSIPLASNAHTSFMLNQQFPITAGRRVLCDSPRHPREAYTRWGFARMDRH